MSAPLLIVLSSPSGGGKTTICDALLARDRRLSRSISATTRAPRGRERQGRDYHFLSDKAFDRLVGSGQFLEWAHVHGHRYGTLKSEVRTKHARRKDVVMVIDVQGGLAVKRNFPEAVLIFIQPPSVLELSRRLKSRGTDGPATIRKRLEHARWEMAFAGQYDYMVVNRTLETAIDQVGAILTAERLKVKKNTGAPHAAPLKKTTK